MKHLTRDVVIIGHNIGFDSRFIAAEQSRTQSISVLAAALCTLKLVTRIRTDLKRVSASSKLQDLIEVLDLDPIKIARRFGVEIEECQKHRAEFDTLGMLFSL